MTGVQTCALPISSALIAGCECEHGCPMCVGPVGETGPLAKTVAMRILQHVLAGLERGAAAAALESSEDVPF